MSKFAQSAATVPEPCRVFGTTLRPFCLGHHLLFKRLKIPFAGNALVDVPPSRIVIGIAICAQSYEETLNQLHAGTWNDVLLKWYEQLQPRYFFGLRRRKIDKALFAEGKALFRAYLEDGYAHVPVWKYQTVNGIALSGPWEVVLKNSLVMSGYTESEALNGYLPARWYDYYALAELAAAEKCADPAKWRKVFYNDEDENRLNPGGPK